jgi:hypothetical protein
MPISGKLCDRCVTDLLALFLGFIALRAEFIAELHIVDVSHKDMASLTAPLILVLPSKILFGKALAAKALGKRILIPNTQ